MSTILGFEPAGGVVLAGSRAAALGGVGRATGSRLVFELDRAGVAVVGDARVVDAVGRIVAAAETGPAAATDGSGDRPSVDGLADRVASILAPRSLTATALVAGYDESEDRAGLRRVDADGSVSAVDRAVLGPEASVERVEAALGGVDADAGFDEATDAARAAIADAIGPPVDAVALPHGER